MPSSGRVVTWGWIVLSSLAGCGSGDDGGSGTADTLRVDGLLLMENLGQRILFDPATGAISQPIDGPFSITPDLMHVLHRKDVATIVVSEIGRADDGTPTLTSRETYSIPGGIGVNDFNTLPVAFNAQGDRLIHETWWNPVTDDHHRTQSVSPDGRHHVSGVYSDAVLYDDATAALPMRLPGIDEGFTSDGAWLVGGDIISDPLYFSLIHVPTKTIVRHNNGSVRNGWPLPRDPVTGQIVRYLGSDARGRLIFARGGNRGMVIVNNQRAASVASLVPITRIAPALLVAGTPGAIEETPTTALDGLPLPDGAEGYEWVLLSITPDATHAILQRRPYRIAASSDGSGFLFYDYLGLDIVVIPLGGSGEPVAAARSTGAVAANSNCEPATLFASDAFRLRLSSNLQFTSERDFVCRTPGGSLLFMGGALRMRTPTFVTLDGGELVGGLPTPAAAIYGDARVTEGLCHGPLDGSATGCIVPLTLWWSRMVVAQVGVDLVPRVTTGPVLASISHRAATPGTTVRLLGYGFGTTGALTLGSFAVPASAISSWTDKAIVFTMPADAPEMARVSVTVDGEVSIQQAIWLGRSETWIDAPVIPHDPMHLRIGQTRITFPGAASYTAEVRGLDQIFPGEGLTTLSLGGGPNDLDVEFLGPDRGYRWIVFKRPGAEVIRPLIVDL